MSIHTLFSKQRTLLSAAGAKAPWILVFDIDSTIMNTGPRNQAIIDTAYAELPELFTERPLLGGEVWDICDTLLQKKSLPAENVPRLRKFWAERFFTNEWLLHDKPYPHVAETLAELKTDDFTLVYLTGRDAPGMETGTRKSFTDNGLPAGTEERFIFKPDFDIPDTEFKRSACSGISALGTIVGTADNMSDNANLLAAFFPKAYNVCFKTVTPPGTQPLDLNVRLLDIGEWE